MFVELVLLLMSVAACVALPTLSVGRRQVLHPRLALAVRLGVLAGAWLSAASLAAVMIVAGVAAAGVAELIEEAALTGLVTLGLGLVAAVGAYGWVETGSWRTAYRDRVDGLTATASSREARGGFTLVKLESAEPLAVAVPGRSPEIQVSAGMEHALTGEQLRAVLAHEYAHLRLRHGWVVRVAEANAVCLPWWADGGRALRGATSLLVELAADDVAARQAGAANLANALVRIGRLTGDPGLELRAERLTMRSWPAAHRRRLPEAIRV